MSPLQAVLIADGSSEDRKILERGFRNRGLDTRVAESCRMATALLRERLPDLVVSELRLPDGSGLALLRDLREISATTRFVVVTNHRSIATAVRAMQLGASNYLLKPARVEQILADPFDADLRNSVPGADCGPASLAVLEWEHLNFTYSKTDGNIAETARHLGKDRRHVRRMLNRPPPER